MVRDYKDKKMSNKELQEKKAKDAKFLKYKQALTTFQNVWDSENHSIFQFFYNNITERNIIELPQMCLQMFHFSVYYMGKMNEVAKYTDKMGKKLGDKGKKTGKMMFGGDLLGASIEDLKKKKAGKKGGKFQNILGGQRTPGKCDLCLKNCIYNTITECIN